MSGLLFHACNRHPLLETFDIRSGRYGKHPMRKASEAGVGVQKEDTINTGEGRGVRYKSVRFDWCSSQIASDTRRHGHRCGEAARTVSQEENRVHGQAGQIRRPLGALALFCLHCSHGGEAL